MADRKVASLGFHYVPSEDHKGEQVRTILLFDTFLVYINVMIFFSSLENHIKMI